MIGQHMADLDKIFGRYELHFDFEIKDKVIDVTVLTQLEDKELKIVLKLLNMFFKNDDIAEKCMIFNTLEKYNLFVTKESLERKMKVKNALK